MDIVRRQHDAELSTYNDVPIRRRSVLSQQSAPRGREKKSFTTHSKKTDLFARPVGQDPHKEQGLQQKGVMQTPTQQSLDRDAHTLRDAYEKKVQAHQMQLQEKKVQEARAIENRKEQVRLMHEKRQEDLRAKRQAALEKQEEQKRLFVENQEREARKRAQERERVLQQSETIRTKRTEDEVRAEMSMPDVLTPLQRTSNEVHSETLFENFSQSPIRDATEEGVYITPESYAVDRVQAPQEQLRYGAPTYTESREVETGKSTDFFAESAKEVFVGDVQQGGLGMSLRRIFDMQNLRRIFSLRDSRSRFALVGLFCMVSLSGFLFIGHALATKDRVTASAEDAIASLKKAAGHAKGGDLKQAHETVGAARDLFGVAQKDISSINALVVSASRYVPGASRLASGDALVNASVHLSEGLREMTELSQKLEIFQKAVKADGLESFSILDIADTLFLHTVSLEKELRAAQAYIDRVDAFDVLAENREEFIMLAQFIDPFIELLSEANVLAPAITELLGGESSRKYLFLFQNNQEMRASGGFIGSYGFLDMDDGHIREFKIDGIYNPDGQLTDKVVPPRPIQKISAAWSLHDSNWWPHFPTSAEKAIEFYARTGGPSVDGVIAVTPTMVEKLLDLTGPIVLSEYGVTLTADNFVELTQYKVEVDYDKEENRPKKILSDLMPALMGELKKDLSQEKIVQLTTVFLEGLEERHVMFYMRNDQIQSIIEKQHWGGRILPTQDDYLSVVHSNINGFKTDGVIDEKISHSVSFAADGRIINTVEITREHGGGNTGREWWDAVNADYMRVYVPLGARLLSANGHTREWPEPRLDYDGLGFERDPDVVREEENAYVDPTSGTRIYEDAGKTVFGNWVYVSPQESVTVTYKYELPWRFVTDSDTQGKFSSYGVLYQKQAGAQNVTLESTFALPQNMQTVSHVPAGEGSARTEGESDVLARDLDSDYYRGIVFRIE